MKPLQLFHRITDPECASTRRLIIEMNLVDEVEFRNVDISETASKELRNLGGGGRLPALWTGEDMIEGTRDIEEFLKWATEEPFPELLENFDRIAHEVWTDLKGRIPSEFHPLISQIQFLILDEPTPELLVDLPSDIAEKPEEICGLNIGTPSAQNTVTSPDPMPTRIYLFRWALMDQIDPEDKNPEGALREEIAVTFLHEVGHSFGLEEDDLHRLGYD